MITPCIIKQLPAAKQIEAARVAIEQNPANKPYDLQRMSTLMPQPQRLAVLITKYWGAKGVDHTVRFMDNPPQDVRAKILLHMNEWGKYANVRYRETNGSSIVRIARTPGDGYWSYLGTDNLLIPQFEPTMNLDSFSINTPDSEYRRVGYHETGHELGFPHEHLRPGIVNELLIRETIDLFMSTQGWSEEEVRANVLTALSEDELIASLFADVESIMAYWLPGSITKSGKDIPGGNTINQNDKAFVGKIYPFIVAPPPPGGGCSPLKGLLRR